MPPSFKKNDKVLLIVGIALVAFALGCFGQGLFGRTGGSLSGAAGALAAQASCDTSVLATKTPSGIVLADLLNLRTGPGLNYQVITMLGICTPVTLVGRSSDNAWLEVSLPGNLGGWVFSGYIQANINISTLNVTTGAGGPLTGASGGGGPRYISVIIQGNQAAAFVTGMPGNTVLSAALSPSGGSGKAVAVASGLSDPQGNITLTFPMPTHWADGSPVTSGTMTLTVSGGGESLTAGITYYTK